MASAPPSTPPARLSRYPALQHRNFRLIWSGLLVSNMGTWMQSVAQSWIIYKLTGNNPLYLGWLGLSFALPMVFVPPLGGALVDRVDRVKLLYITQTASLLLAALLAALTWLGLIAPAHLLAASFLEALLLAFDNPARQSLIPELVPRRDLLNALSFNSATFTGAALVGPALAGVLLDVVGAGWLFFLNALSYLAVIGALCSMRDLPVRAVRATSLAEALFGGIRYALYEQSESKTPLLQMTTRWDTPTDGDEFLQVFRSTLTGSGDVQQRGEIFVAIKGSGQEYTILFSPDEQALRTALAALP